MEAIIRTKDKNAFNSLIQFLKTLNFEVETKQEKHDSIVSQKQTKGKKKTEQEIRSFYDTIRVDMSNFKFNREQANER